MLRNQVIGLGQQRRVRGESLYEVQFCSAGRSISMSGFSIIGAFLASVLLLMGLLGCKFGAALVATASPLQRSCLIIDQLVKSSTTSR